MQKSFSDLEYAAKKMLTWRDRFLAEIDSVTPWSKMQKYIAFCLDEQETAKMFGGSRRTLTTTTAEEMGKLSVVNQYPASMALFVCSPNEIKTYEDPKTTTE